MTFFRTTAAASALVMAATAVQATPITVGDVDVQTELSSAETSDALKYWPALADDMKTKLAEELYPITQPGGYDVTVMIRELSLDGSYVLGDAGEFNTIGGVVSVMNPEDTTDVQSFALDLKGIVTDTAPDDATVVLLPEEGDFYEALVAGFAKLTADRIAEMNKSTEAIADETNDENKDDDEDES
ncbi:hypothetical protein [Oceanomicrobium pacificus]|uniref:Uncharacterized protein n=1 Tax=Oceanomicrobium pacificus TaxID=2692916 RepID=A0A6B0U407_9RHOB|nr:hypothetical protein [Oceanomicrobium pacificus]MXU65681.1 hypothetical protein [Oceanomicrobium pacificus]